MSPYVVTTKRRSHERPVEFVSREVVSRRAVATLDEARTIVQGGWTRHQVEQAITESGGTVGPLPDGTVIEVERAEWEDLAEPFTPASFFGEAAIVAAFNAQEATR